MNATVRQQLAGLLELAECMQARAEASDWEEVARLRDRFQQCVEALFAGQASHEEALALSDVVGRVSAINNDIISLCRDARDAQGRDLENLKQGRRAISSYSSNTG